MKKSIFKTSLSLTVLLIASLLCSDLHAQTRDRDFIRNQISYRGKCRNVAITKYNGDLMLYGSNGWAATGCPKGLTDALNQLNEDDEFIDDVQLTEQGRWLILYGNNGIQYYDIPYKLEQTLKEYNAEREVITSVSFNDDGDWIVVTTKHVSTSASEITQWLKDGMDEYGKVWATCITDDAVVVVYEHGFTSVGDIPDTLYEALEDTSIDVYRLKIAGDAWFFSDGKSKYSYNM